MNVLVVINSCEKLDVVDRVTLIVVKFCSLYCIVPVASSLSFFFTTWLESVTEIRLQFPYYLFKGKFFV